MLQVKYKVWDVERKRMGQVLILHLGDDGIFGAEADFGGKDSETVFGTGFIYLAFTTRHDLDGKEIYEGDILEFGDNQHLTFVFWNDKTAEWLLRKLPNWTNHRGLWSAASDYHNIARITGNIYQNPDFLESLDV